MYVTLDELIKYKIFEEWFELQKHTTVIIFITGESGAGKSSLMLKLMYEFEKYACEKMGKEFKFNLDEQIVYIPNEYGKKIKNWIEKDYFTLGVDEARFLVSAKTWQSFINRIITEVNATVRQLKMEKCGYCGLIFLNSQTLQDVDKSLRKTIKYLIRILLDESRNRKMKLYKIYYNILEDEFYFKKMTIKLLDYEIIIDVNVTRIEDTELLHQFHKKIVEAKSKILAKKFEKLEHALKQETGELFNKEILKDENVFQMVKNLASFSEKKGVYFTPEKREIIMKMFNLTKKEFKELFLPAFMQELKERNLI